MSSKAFHMDGLWLCLRPAFSQTTARRSASVLPRQKLTRTTARSSSTSAPTALDTPSTASTTPEGSGNTIWRQLGTRAEHNAVRHRNVTKPREEKRVEQNSYQWTLPKHWKQRTRVPHDFAKYPDATLETFLEEAATGRTPDYLCAARVAKELVEIRGVKPNTRLYTKLIYANADAERGSPYQVRRLLEEMEDNDILADSATFHAALRALAVHPDYILRHEILQTLRERWIPLSPAGWHDVVVGYTRERQYEMALNTLSHMESQQVPVEDWLYGLLIYNLCDAEEFGEALRLMKRRLASGHNLSPNLWIRVLDLASEALDEEMVSFIWHRRVETGYINPAFGVCNNILTIASRTGNTRLAMSVFKIFEERNAPFTPNDYEALVDAYVVAGEFESALRVLSTVKSLSPAVELSSTHSILRGLMTSKLPPLDAWRLMKRLRDEENLDIPIVAVNALLEHCAVSVDFDAAVQIYKELHLVSSEKHSTDTFNGLLHIARRSKSAATAKYFLDEMRRSGVFPNGTTYQNLILLSVEQGDFVEAQHYFVEMTQSGFNLTEPGRWALQKVCKRSQKIDAQRFWRIVTERRAMSRHEVGKLAECARVMDVEEVEAMGNLVADEELVKYRENARASKAAMERAAASVRNRGRTRRMSNGNSGEAGVGKKEDADAGESWG